MPFSTSVLLKKAEQHRVLTVSNLAVVPLYALIAKRSLVMNKKSISEQKGSKRFSHQLLYLKCFSRFKNSCSYCQIIGHVI